MFPSLKPVPPAHLHGRDSFIKSAVNEICAQRYQNLAIVGLPRSGKTSILEYMVSDLASEKYTELSQLQKILIYADEIGRHGKPADFWLSLASQLAELISDPNANEQLLRIIQNLQTRATVTFTEHIRPLIGLLNQYNLKVLVCIDEFEFLLENSNFLKDSSDFFSILRRLGQKQNNPILFTITLRHPPEDLYHNSQGSFWPNVFPVLYVPLLTSNEAESIVNNLLLSCGEPELSIEERKLVGKHALGHPELTQAVFGSILSSRRKKFSFQDLENHIAAQIQEKIRTIYDAIFDSYLQNERQAIAALIKNQPLTPEQRLDLGKMAKQNRLFGVDFL